MQSDPVSADSATDISVIIPTNSNRVPLEKCLRSVLRQSLAAHRYEILLVNNGGKDHSERFLKPLAGQAEGRVRIIEAGRNRGYPGGCRVGADAACGKYLAFHNDDALVDPCWLALALGEFSRIPDLGVVTCRIANAGDPVLQHEGSTQTRPNALFWQTGYGLPDEPVSLRKPATGEAWTAQDLDFFSGCIWATPRTVWEETGGLSEAYRPGYYEDSEYALRCRQLGYRIRLLRTVTCGHYGSLTLGYGSSRYWTAFHRSRFLFLLRNQTGNGWREILGSEAEWWFRYTAGFHPWHCIAGFARALPALPRAILERRRFAKRMGRLGHLRP